MKVNVHALMPTLPARKEMCHRAIRSFYKQRFPKEWSVSLLVDPGPETLGFKLNRMIQRVLELDATRCGKSVQLKPVENADVQ